MTLGVNNRNDYVGNGAVDTYSYTFKIFAATDLEVTVRDDDDVETVLGYPADYTVTGAGIASGGTIVLTAGDLDDGFALTIRRVVSLVQSTDIRNQSSLFPEVIENEFDRLVMIDQQQQDEIARAVKVPVTALPSLDTAFPPPGAGKFIRWNVAGTALETVGASPADNVFLQSGAGAVSRSWTSKAGDVLNVRDFGALLDGLTDDTAAFNAAILAAYNAGGGTVTFGPGTAIVADIVLRNKVELVGAGMASTALKLKNSGNTDVLKTLVPLDTYYGTGNVLVGNYGIRLANFTIDGNKANNSSGRGLAAYWYKCSMEHVMVFNCKTYGIKESWGTFGTPVPWDSMENTYTDVSVVRCDGTYQWDHNGPHDSRFFACITAQGIGTANLHTGTYGAGAMFVNCHSWSELGVRQPLWSVIFDGQNSMWSNSSAEGGSVGQIKIRNADVVIRGGSQYSIDSSYHSIGIQIGDAANGFTNISGYDINTMTRNFQVATVAFDSDGGLGRIEINAYNSIASTLYAGTPATTSLILMRATGFGGQLYQIPDAAVFGAGGSPQTMGSGPHFMNVHGTVNGFPAAFSMWINSDLGPQMTFCKSRNTTPGSHTIVQVNDIVMNLVGVGDDGVNYNSVAGAIGIGIDDTPGAADMPGRIVFLTTPKGSNAAVERMRIDNKGNVVLGGAAVATNAIAGFAWIPACAGPPTGVPAASYSGRIPLVIDSSNNKLYFYSGGAWRDAGP